MHKPMKHVRKAEKTQVRVEASATEPGNVILTITSDAHALTVNMNPEEWLTFMQATTTIAIEAHGRLLSACMEDNQTNPNLS